MNEHKTKQVMRRLVANHFDHVTGEVNCTALAEETADELNVNHVGGPLDDETHPIWIWAVQVGQAHEQEQRR